MLPTPESLEGKPVPQVTFKARPDDQWRDIGSDELFKGKTVVVFSLPGAYTPTCSSTHLPRYNELAPVFRDNGVDEIVCMAVNDAFVMNEWKQGQDAANITVIPDGNGDFSEGMGMLVDKRNLGFGMRSWRYSMLVQGRRHRQGVHRAGEGGRPVRGVRRRNHAALHQPGRPGARAGGGVLQAGLPALRARQGRARWPTGSATPKFRRTSASIRACCAPCRAQSTWPQVFIGGKLIGNADALEQHLAASKAPSFARAMRLSVLDQSPAIAGHEPAEAIARLAGAGAPLRRARLQPLLAVGAPQQQQHRRQRARSADGGDCRHHPPHPDRQRRHHAAALFGPQGGRAVPRAGGARPRPHRPRRGPRARFRPPDGARAEPARQSRRGRVPAAGASTCATGSRAAACRPAIHTAASAPSRRAPGSPDMWMLGSSELRRPAGRPPGPAVCVRLFLQRRQGRRGGADLYRSNYQPSERYPHPQATICVWALACDTEARGRSAS